MPGGGGPFSLYAVLLYAASADTPVSMSSRGNGIAAWLSVVLVALLWLPEFGYLTIKLIDLERRLRGLAGMGFPGPLLATLDGLSFLFFPFNALLAIVVTAFVVWHERDRRGLPSWVNRVMGVVGMITTLLLRSDISRMF